MAGDDDPPWENEFDENAETRIDKREVLPGEAVPEPIEARTTGKYKTLSGYASADVQNELAFGRGCAHCTKKVLTALRLAQMASGTHPAIADAQVEKLRAWMEDPANAELIRVAMKG